MVATGDWAVVRRGQNCLFLHLPCHLRYAQAELMEQLRHPCLYRLRTKNLDL
jgi:hypothetical protein